ncbi:hypothetical protein ACIBCT_21290 [Streptosporangium sp. NPDC050855]|uniref:hypothetical protein n=1 Tax=Streptosporangium sp. NPDC050855 TaxID=3366194 RepID=UPI0037ABDF38
MITTVLLWTSLVAGLIPMTWFLAQFRPSWPIRSPAYLISGLMLAIWIAYVRVGVVLAIRGWIPRMDSWVDATASIVPLMVVDAMVIGLLVSFLRYRTAWRSATAAFSKEDPHG